MEIRDPIHGSISISRAEQKIIEHPFFQRLRKIKQLGFSEYIFPGATHTRYLHSIGVMNTTEQVFAKLFKNKIGTSSDWNRLQVTCKLAGLLHDIGHAPLSHSTETVMPNVSELKLPANFRTTSRQATHEDYTIKAIVDSFFTECFNEIEKNEGVTPQAIAELISGKTTEPGYFTVEGINYFPVLHQLISSELDCDRMDYLLRDSYFCGVSYGKYDLDWLIDNLKLAIINDEAYLAISERALTTFDDFLISRFHMFLMVYFHYRAVCLEQMMYKYFSECPNEYAIPASIEEYLRHDDHHLLKILKSSKNSWAQNIVHNRIPQKILEVFGEKYNNKVDELKNFLHQENLDYILCESTGRLSKYSHENEYPIKVIYQHNHEFSNIEEATDLFQKYSSAHAVTRIHLELDRITPKQLSTIRAIIDSNE